MACCWQISPLLAGWPSLETSAWERRYCNQDRKSQVLKSQKGIVCRFLTTGHLGFTTQCLILKLSFFPPSNIQLGMYEIGIKKSTQFCSDSVFVKWKEISPRFKKKKCWYFSFNSISIGNIYFIFKSNKFVILNSTYSPDEAVKDWTAAREEPRLGGRRATSSHKWFGEAVPHGCRPALCTNAWPRAETETGNRTQVRAAAPKINTCNFPKTERHSQVPTLIIWKPSCHTSVWNHRHRCVILSSEAIYLKRDELLLLQAHYNRFCFTVSVKQHTH